MSSFQQPNAKQEQNRKILEELQLKKKLMLKQQTTGTINSNPAAPVAPTLTPSVAPSSSTAPVPTPSNSSIDYQGLNKNQRTALQHAHANSFASFIPQDSSFGNLILPVMPRFDK